jgi:nucleoside-diphosphate-sugar epimerase
MTTLITGSTGWVGKEVSKLLKGDFFSLSTRPKTNSHERHFCCDISETEQTTRLADAIIAKQIPIDTVIHCAALAHNPRESKERFFSVNAQGTKNIVRLCETINANRLVYISSIASYDWTNTNIPLPRSEESQLAPLSDYAQSKTKGEQYVMESDLDWRIARLSTVFGIGDPANFLRLAHAIRNRRFIIPGDGLSRKSVIPVELAALLICELAKTNTLPHRLVNVALPNAPTLKEICDAFSQICQFATCRSTPLPIMSLLAKLGDAINLVRPFPLNTQILDQLNQSTWVETNRLQSNFPDIHFKRFIEYLEDHRQFYKKT